MDDFYKLLKISPKASSYKIAITYKKKIAYLVNSSEKVLDIDNFIKINQAYFVLSNEQGRKFYDILYQCLIKNALHLNEQSILKYTSIVEDLAEEGVKKAKLWLENLDNLKDSDLIKPLFVLFLLQGLLSGNGGLSLSGAGGIIFILASFSFVLKISKHFTYEYFALTIFLSLFGTIVLMSRYREFVVSKVAQETIV